MLKALWRGFCGVADTINNKQMGQTDEALDELQSGCTSTPRRSPSRSKAAGRAP